MFMRLRELFVAIVLATGAVAPAHAASFTDPKLYEDLVVGDMIVFDGINVTGSPAGSASLFIRFGGWTGNSAVIDLDFTFNGVLLTPPLVSSGAYFSSPENGTYDVSGLVVNGLNTLSVVGTLVSGGPTTFAVGELTLTTQSTVVPLPAALPLLVAAVGGLGFVSRRRRTRAH